MKISQLVATMVLRSGQVFQSVSWAKIGLLYGLTQDQVRHRVTTFKKNFNVIDDDVKDPNWPRKFLSEHAQDSEKLMLQSFKFYPGEFVKSSNETALIYDISIDDENVYDLYFDDGSMDEMYESELVGEESDIKIVANTSYVASTTTIEVNDIPAPQYIVTPMVLIVVRNGQPLTIDKSHKNFDKIKDALDKKQWQLVFDLIDMKNALKKYSNGRVTVENGSVVFDGKKVHGKLADRLADSLVEENLDSLEALANFMVKCDDNPDARVLSRLFSFMSAKDIRIDKDGDFYAYKVVRNDYLDKHSGTMDNSPGKKVWMKRNQVNPVDSETCSTGLHVCSKSYIKHFSGGGDRVVLCKVHPKDVVSVPTDYGDAKMRTCEYYVVKDVTENFVDSDQPGVRPQ